MRLKKSRPPDQSSAEDQCKPADARDIPDACFIRCCLPLRWLTALVCHHLILVEERFNLAVLQRSHGPVVAVVVRYSSEPGRPSTLRGTCVNISVAVCVIGPAHCTCESRSRCMRNAASTEASGADKSCFSANAADSPSAFSASISPRSAARHAFMTMVCVQPKLGLVQV